MEGKSSFLTGEVSHLIPNACSDTRLKNEKQEFFSDLKIEFEEEMLINNVMHKKAVNSNSKTTIFYNSY